MPQSLKSVLAAVVAALFVIAAPIQAADWSTLATQMRSSIGYLDIWQTDDGGELADAGSCTAFSINDQKDYFLTADHCLGDVMKVDGHDAFPIYQDDAADLLVLVVPESGSYPAVKLATEVAPGEAVASYGFGYGLSLPTFRAGVITTASIKFPRIFEGLGYGGPDEEYCLFDAALIHGMSGGPVFNDKGEIVSIAQILIPDNTSAGRSIGELSVKVGKYFTADK